MTTDDDKTTPGQKSVQDTSEAEKHLRELFHLALRKLKGYAYWDKTRLYLVDQLVQYESRGKGDKDDSLTERVYEALLSKEQKPWTDVCNELLSGVGFLCYPKKVARRSDDSERAKNLVISDIEHDEVEVNEAQYFIKLSPLGHLLGIIWAMTIGAALDTAEDGTPVMYQHSYGNRLRKRLFVGTSNNTRITDSPHFMEPYFTQYVNWRDRALERAQACVRDGQDIIIATLDIRKFFYCVDIDKDKYNGILKQYREHSLLKALKDHYDLTDEALKRLHGFVYRVMERYSTLLAKENPFAGEKDAPPIRKEQVLLPIGFIPSLVLSNWVMMPFDDAITNRINPVYYGRYVDDIILVDKVKQNSKLYKQARGEAKATDLCRTLFKSLLKQAKSRRRGRNQTQEQQPSTDDKDRSLYIDEKALTNTTKLPSLRIQDDKLKCFYFEGGKPATLLDCFQRQIVANASGFRFLPELDNAFLKNDYGDIFDLKVGSSPNKLREVEGGKLSRFATSRFLGKLYNIVHVLRQEKGVGRITRDLSVLLRSEDLIDNFPLWERLLEIALLAGDHCTYATLVHNMYTGIARIRGTKREHLQMDMKRYLEIAMDRTLSLVWGSHVDKLVKDINEKVTDSGAILGLLKVEKVSRLRYIATAMTGQYTTPLPIWCADTTRLKETKEDISLFTFEGMKAAINWAEVKEALPKGHFVNEQGLSEGHEAWCKRYTELFRSYLEKSLKACDALPYVLSPGEIAYMYATFCMACGRPLDTLLSDRVVRTCYAAINTLSTREDEEERPDLMAHIPMVAVSPFPEALGRGIAGEERVIVQIGPAPASPPESAPELKLRIALANIRLSKEFAGAAMRRDAVLSYSRLRRFRDLTTQAQRERADILVLPEYALPHAWLPDVIRLCAKEQMAIITGIEPIPLGSTTSPEGVKKPTIYNLTAVILPYTLEDGSRFANLTFHHKVHYAPGEIEIIGDNHCTYTCGNTHHLFHWRGVWFSVFCCFELASIAERAAFGHIPDMTVAVEWNKDIAYFSNIMESLSRDIYCYCVQINSSEYGDNRIVTPMERVRRDPVRIKGGRNETIITHDLDIALLRACQLDKGAAKEKEFKPLPPGFAVIITKMKRAGTLYDWLTQDPRREQAERDSNQEPEESDPPPEEAKGERPSEP